MASNCGHSGGAPAGAERMRPRLDLALKRKIASTVLPLGKSIGGTPMNPDERTHRAQAKIACLTLLLNTAHRGTADSVRRRK